MRVRRDDQGSLTKADEEVKPGQVGIYTIGRVSHKRLTYVITRYEHKS